MPKSNALMLPGNVQPRKYTLRLEPDLANFTFNGEETIEIEVLEPTSSISLNSVEIVIQSCQLTLSSGRVMTARDISLDKPNETATFRFDSAIPAGVARLQIKFTGELNDRLRGFYRSRYTDANGQERYMASTQFEATDARRAFPCWDEPALKATFDLTLVIPSDLVAVSNMPVVGEETVRPGVKAVRFGETPIMSTYLLAFAVGDLRSIEQRAEDGTLIRVWATRGKEEQGRFALETSVRLLAYFNQYFGIPYPLPKLDHLAIPDFAAGAMENWGAITYRETTLLVDPQNSSAGTRQTVAAIVAHEMAHMWFGDLVTMAWWNDLWLNESFASWMGDKATDHLFPEWEMWTQFVTYDTNRALGLDGLRNSHPIDQEVKNPAEIGQLFDAISYSKGASILRMLEHFLGAEAFQRGLHNYLSQHKYANAETRDLWNALGEASGQPVAAIMDTWVKQLGYPVLDVGVKRQRNGVSLTFSQSRFVYESILGQPGSNGADATIWKVPISVRTPRFERAASLVMDGPQATTRLRGGAKEWLKVNPLQTGFYRVKYPPEEWQMLVGPIQSLELPAADRLGIQNDAYALARAGHIPATQFLAIAEAYVNETDASVCADLAANLGGLDNLVSSESFYPRFQAFARNIFQPIGWRTGWDAKPGEGHLDALRRSTVLMQLGEYDDEDTLREAGARFQRYAQNPTNVHPDIRGAVLCLAPKRGDRSTYEAMWELERQAKLQEEKVRLLIGLSRFPQTELMGETLRRSLSPDEVRVQDTVTVVTNVADNRGGRDLAWEFMKENWAEFHRRYGDGEFAMMRLVSITGGFTTPERREDVERFFRDHPTPEADRTIRQSLERIQLNVAWLGRNRDELERWFVG
jgi:puromycin-sensitive aminopeptidase